MDLAVYYQILDVPMLGIMKNIQIKYKAIEKYYSLDLKYFPTALTPLIIEIQSLLAFVRQMPTNYLKQIINRVEYRKAKSNCY